MTIAFRLPVLAAAACSLLASTAARADDQTANGVEGAKPESTKKGAEIPFAFVTDPTTNAGKQLAVGYGVGMASAGAADRPLPPDPTSGIVHSTTGSYGVTSRFSPFATAMLKEGGVNPGQSLATGMIGFRFQLTDPSSPF